MREVLWMNNVGQRVINLTRRAVRFSEPSDHGQQHILK